MLRRRTQEMPEPKLKQLLVELCLLPFGYSYRELPADNPLAEAAQRYGVKPSKEARQKAVAAPSSAPKTRLSKPRDAKAKAKGAGA